MSEGGKATALTAAFEQTEIEQHATPKRHRLEV